MNVPPFPKRIEIEMASACNLRCTYCPRQFVDDLHGFIDPALFCRLIDEAARHPQTVLVLHRRGESLLHPDFLRLIAHVKGRFATIQLATNATLLDADKARALAETVSFLSFSLDTPERYEKVRRPARYEQVCQNIDRFLSLNEALGHPVTTQASMVQTETVTAADVACFEAIWGPKVDRVRIYEQHSADGRFGSLGRRREGRQPCVMPFYEMLVYCDGAIGRCNHDWDGQPIGDLRRQSIAQIWQGAAYADLRRQHRELDIVDPVCRHCDSWYPQEGIQGTGKVHEK